MDRYRIGYLRLTQREYYLGETVHWVKQALRLHSGHTHWNGSGIQLPHEELVLGESFWVTDKHYSDWVHIMDRHTSATVIEHAYFAGETVAERLLRGDWREAWNGAVTTEFDYAVKHWMAYALGLISATGVFREPNASTACSSIKMPRVPAVTATCRTILAGWTPSEPAPQLRPSQVGALTCIRDATSVGLRVVGPHQVRDTGGDEGVSLAPTDQVREPGLGRRLRPVGLL